MKKIIFNLLLIIGLGEHLLAGHGTGKVIHIYAHEKNDKGVIMFAVEQHHNKPSCSSHEWAFDAHTTQGQAMYALLLSAASQGKTVYVHGKNDCAHWGDRERPSWIRISF